MQLTNILSCSELNKNPTRCNSVQSDLFDCKVTLHVSGVTASIINQSINPLACAECGDSLPFSGASSIPPCQTLFPATPLHRPFFQSPSLHPAIYFLVCLLVLLFPDSYTILFWESYFLPFSVHVQTNVIYASIIRSTKNCNCSLRFRS